MFSSQASKRRSYSLYSLIRGDSPYTVPQVMVSRRRACPCWRSLDKPPGLCSGCCWSCRLPGATGRRTPWGDFNRHLEEGILRSGMEVGIGRVGYPAVPQATKGSPGGKLPSGNLTKPSRARSVAAASRKQATRGRPGSKFHFRLGVWDVWPTVVRSTNSCS
jgi:hypothetical protein